MGNVNAAAPNEAIVVSGGCTTREQKLVIGGWVWSWWLVSHVEVNVLFIFVV